jgi:hypothetical protein
MRLTTASSLILLAVLMLAAPPVARGDSITLVDSGAPMVPSGGFSVVNTQFLAQEFTLPVGATITEIAIFVANSSTEPENVKVQVTNAIGPGTPGSALFAEFSLTVPPPFFDQAFRTIPTFFFLDAGTYFLVLSSNVDFGDGFPVWIFDAPTNIGPSFFSISGLDPAFPPASNFTPILQGPLPFFDPALGLRISGIPVPQVEIDIKPGNDPNAINPAGRGLIPVAILTTDTFDATTVSPITVRFGPVGASLEHKLGHLADVDGDGDLDLVLHFRTQEAGIQCGDTEASLTGETFDGQAIQGSDSIVTVGCS